MKIQSKPNPTISLVLEKGRIELIDAEFGAMTREVYLARINDEKYILRRAATEYNRKRYEKYTAALKESGVVPRLYEQQGNDFLFEFLEGRDLRKDDQVFAFDVGRISGLVNKIPDDLNPNLDIDFDSRFERSLKYLFDNKVITAEEQEKARNSYQRFRPSNIFIGNDLTDVTPGNFRLSFDHIFLVDIDSIWPEFIGRGFAKAYLRWFTKPESRNEFRRGYDSVNDSSFLTPDYLQFIYLNFLVNKAKELNKTNMPLKNNITFLREALDGGLK